jgi:hypothetical protein
LSLLIHNASSCREISLALEMSCHRSSKCTCFSATIAVLGLFVFVILLVVE